MSDFAPFAACLRLNMVTISQADAEAALGVSIARFEPIGKSGQHYAQIDIECELQPAIRIAKAINAIGPKLRVLLEKKQVESAVLDMAAEIEGFAHSAAERLRRRIEHARIQVTWLRKVRGLCRIGEQTGGEICNETR